MAGDIMYARFYEQAALRWAEVKQSIPIDPKEEKRKAFYTIK